MSNNRSIRVSAIALAVVGTLFASQAFASGFQLREQSVKNLGKSSAGSMIGKDAAVVALNPAAMVNLKQNTFQADVTVIDLSAKFTGGGTVFGAPGALPHATLTGSNGGDPGDPTAVPNISAVFPMHGALEGLTLGAAIGAPFGLATEYEPGWVGRYRALTSDVKTVDLTLSAAFSFNDAVSVGVGLIYERADATLSKDIDFGTALCASSAPVVPGVSNCFNPAWPAYPAFHPQSADGSLVVKGSDSNIGYVIGAQVAPSDRLAIGISYRSEIRHDLKGTLDFSVPGSVATAMGPLAAAYADGPGGAKLVTPDIMTLSVKFGVTDNLRLLGDFQRTGWSSLQNVTITRDTGAVLGSEPFDWVDTNFWSLGAEYDLSPAITLRGGVGKDETPTNDTHRTPRLPDNDRMLYSIGLSWNVSEHLSLDAGYQHITIDSPTINLPFDAASGNLSTLVGEYRGHANLFGVSMQYRF